MSDMAVAHLDYAAELGIKYIIDPMATFSTYEEALAFAAKLDAVGAQCKKRGITFGYHNHRHEFLQGKDGYLLETILLNTNPENVCIQLDAGWATCSGVNVPEFIAKYPGRFKLIHVKECNHVAGPEAPIDWAAFPRDENGRPQIPAEVIENFRKQAAWNVAAGTGIIDWPAVVKAALAQGADGFITEREYDYKGDIFIFLEEDVALLKSL